MWCSDLLWSNGRVNCVTLICMARWFCHRLRSGVEWWLLGSLILIGAPRSSVGAWTDDTAEFHFRRANELQRLGKLDEAEREYRLGLRIAPTSPMPIATWEPYILANKISLGRSLRSSRLTNYDLRTLGSILISGLRCFKPAIQRKQYPI